MWIVLPAPTNPSPPDLAIAATKAGDDAEPIGAWMIGLLIPVEEFIRYTVFWQWNICYKRSEHPTLPSSLVSLVEIVFMASLKICM